jgi:tRNA threonylcarbamoyladenosine biosynthesis protein TsaB
MPAIDGAIRDAGGSPRDIERIAVSIGPGGFTPLRIAATVVKVLAYATGAHIVPIPSAEVVAARVKRDGAAFAVALASKNSDAWVSAFNAQSTTARWSGLLDAGGIAALGIRRLIADSFLPQSMRTQASELGIAIEAPVFDPVACLERSLSGTVEIPMALAPLYPREPEAVRKWRELHPRT